MQRKYSTMVSTITVLALLTAVAVGAKDVPQEEIYNRCKKLTCESMACCKMDELTPEQKDMMKECTKFPEESCENAKCIGNILGFATADDSFDKAKATEMFERDIKGKPEMIAALKDKCVNGDLSKYGMPGKCEILRFRNCMKVHILGRCTSWDTTGSCAGIKEAAADCFSIFA